MYDLIREELELIAKFTASLALLLLASLYNYIRTLDKETLITDMLLLKSVMRGERICLKDKGTLVFIENHKRIATSLLCTCSDCDTCSNIKHHTPSESLSESPSESK